MFSMKSSADLIDNKLDRISKSGIFTCTDGQSISEIDRCDGFVDCNDGSDETELECYDRICPPEISFQCAYGGCIELDNKCNLNIDCVDESDEDQQLCGYKHPIGSKCEIPRRFRNGDCYEIGCMYGEKRGSCDKIADPTNVCLLFTCRNGFVIDEYRSFYNTSCVNGNWQPEIPVCIECATKIAVEPLIFLGSVRKHVAPWNIGLFNVTNVTNPSVFCGGTIVHSKAVVTAAHCLKRIDYMTSEVYDPTDTQVRLAVGKIYSNYSRKEPGEQWLEVEEIFANPDYNHEYYKDIAVIKVKEKIQFGKTAMPVCLNINEKYIAKPVQGKVVGWGSVLEDVFVGSDTLLESNFNVTWGIKDCKNALHPDYRRYITRDKFCLEKRPDMPSVEQGDSGSGFITRIGNHYYLYGLVSLKIDRVRAFTNVSYHKEWLMKTIEFN